MADPQPIEIGSRLELLVDEYLIETMQGAALRLHNPVPREVAMVFDRPWEGSGSGYVTVLRDGDLYRMYYKGSDLAFVKGALARPVDSVCYAESEDGINWVRPELGIIEHEGSGANNIVWRGQGDHGFCPFIDGNPDCSPQQRFKSVGQGQFDEKAGLWALASADGLHWSLMGDRPILYGTPFDSQNLVFWDTVRGEYRAYVRFFRDGQTRDILTTTSPDFSEWAEYEQLRYPGAPDEQLYTNQIQPYPRAPHIFVGLPARYIERGWSPSMEALPDSDNRHMRSDAHERFGMAVSDTLLMTSRDGVSFRRADEAFLPPGIQRPGTWAYGGGYASLGLPETASDLPGAPAELSIYAMEGLWVGPASVRRYSLRMDGFMSAHAPLSGGELITKPLVFEGERLVLNFATSAAGTIRVELLDAAGRQIDGFTLADCDEVFGDEVQRVVTWNEGADVSALAGTPVRLRLTLKDADLYSFRFTGDHV